VILAISATFFRQEAQRSLLTWDYNVLFKKVYTFV